MASNGVLVIEQWDTFEPLDSRLSSIFGKVCDSETAPLRNLLSSLRSYYLSDDKEL